MRDLHAPLRKRHLSVQVQSTFCELSSTTFQRSRSYFFLGQKLNRFQPYGFLILDVSQKPHVTWEETAESTPHRYWANGSTGEVFVIFFSRGDGIVNCGPSAYICIAQQQSCWRHCWKVAIFRISYCVQQCQVYSNLRDALLHFSCCSFWAVFVLPIYLFVCTIWAFGS